MFRLALTARAAFAQRKPAPLLDAAPVADTSRIERNTQAADARARLYSVLDIPATEYRFSAQEIEEANRYGR